MYKNFKWPLRLAYIQLFRCTINVAGYSSIKYTLNSPSSQLHT